MKNGQYQIHLEAQKEYPIPFSFPEPKSNTLGVQGA